MSYILDALRKADAQRERDPSRGIHAHPAPLGGSFARSGGAAPWTWVAVAIGVVALAAAASYAINRTAAPTAAAPVVQAPPVIVVPPTPAPEPQASPRVAVAKEISPPPAPARIAPPPPDPTNTSRPPLRGVPQTNLMPHMGGAAMAPAAVTARVPQPAPQQQPAAPAAAVTGLPPDAPKVSISGGVYSPSPAQRMLIVNGQVFNEGSEVAPGLAIEKIEPRTAVLKFRGALYTITY